jgi:hypothetical protein
VWHSWDHHSCFSNIDAEKTIAAINTSQQKAHEFLKNADWLIITLGTAFSYELTGEAIKTGTSKTPATEDWKVANCHRAPAQWFEKHLSSIEEINTILSKTIDKLLQFNPKLNIIFTISPVRHIRDGVVENNRSKARLIEAVHQLTDEFNNVNYFPSYELVIDVLRDYRFYAEDMVHPNYAATGFVLEKFIETHISNETQKILPEIIKLNVARKHNPVHPSTDAHKNFLQTYLERTKSLKQQFPYLNFEEEIFYFSKL